MQDAGWAGAVAFAARSLLALVAAGLCTSVWAVLPVVDGDESNPSKSAFSANSVALAAAAPGASAAVATSAGDGIGAGAGDAADARSVALRVGYIADDPPFSSRDAAGVPHGLGIDLIQALSRRVPFTIAELVPVGVSQARRALIAGDVDLVFGLTSDRPEHDQLLMLGPVLASPVAIASADRLELTGPSRLAGLAVAVPVTVGPVLEFESLNPQPAIQICATPAECLGWLAEGRVQAVVAGLHGISESLKHDPKLAGIRITGTIGEPSLQRRYMSLMATRGQLAERLEAGWAEVLRQDYVDIQAAWSRRLLTPTTDWPAIRRWVILAAAIALAFLAGLIGHIRVTERQAERVRRAEQRAGHYLGFLAHEVRNTLQSIAGAALQWRRHQASSKSSAPPWSEAELREMFNALALSAEQSLGHLDGLLDQDRLRTRTLGLQRRPEPLPRLVLDLIDELQPLAAVHRRRIELSVNPSLSGWWLVDAVRLQQVLRLVLRQVLNASGPATVQLEVAAQPSSHDAGWTHWVIAMHSGDAATGDLARERAFDLDDAGETIPLSQSPGGGRPGRSLRLARELAAAMGGTLELDRRPGRGMGFLLHLDLQASPDGDAVAPVALRRVLLVDDARAYGLLLKRACLRRGLQATLAGSVDEAAALLADTRRTHAPAFDLVLCDSHLPDGGLHDLLALRRQLSGQGVTMPPVMGLSADFDTADIRTLTAEGALDLLTKDADVDDLVRRVMRSWEAGRQVVPNGSASGGALPGPDAAPAPGVSPA